MISIKPFDANDAGQIADLLNPIIEDGTTTALTGVITGADVLDWATNRKRPAWHVAVKEDGLVVGFQWINQLNGHTREAADIATFARIGHAGLGIGHKLFETTEAAARDLGYTWINANIREDNVSGLTYYNKIGFRDYDRIENYALGDGRVVNKILKRFDL
ncbi:MAG: GNAT family N-acetyltransferase [Pseudomonadota bacterium]